MAMLDPFSPGQTADPNAGLAPDTYTQVKGQWDAFLQNPQGRAALLSAGIALMQPPSFGDTTTGQIGRALGAAGQSATANQAMDIKESEAESKQDLRASQATAAEARAAAAGARAETAGARAGAATERLALVRDAIEQRRQAVKLQQQVRLSIAYNNYVKGVQSANAFASPKDQKPILPIEEWARTQTLVPGLGGGSGVDDDEDPPVPTTTGGGAVGPAPSDPAARKAGIVYTTPKGALRWTGTGWVRP